MREDRAAKQVVQGRNREGPGVSLEVLLMSWNPELVNLEPSYTWTSCPEAQETRIV